MTIYETSIDTCRAQVGELAEATRSLLEALTLTKVGSGELEEATAAIRDVTRRLRGAQRAPTDSSPYDLPVSGGRMFSLGHGPGNPMAPPLVYSWDGDEVEARCTLGQPYEGPKGHSHGGMTALLLDDVLARIPQLVGIGRVTRELTITYRRPVPLDTPLLVRARLESRVDTMFAVTGSIRRDDGSAEDLVSATARFTVLRDDQLKRINPNWKPGDRWAD